MNKSGLFFLFFFTCLSSFAQPCVINEDFSIQRDPCNPYSVVFKTTSTTHTSIQWLTGDGNIINNQNSFQYTYPDFGVYDVKMIITTPTCTGTISKSVRVEIIKEDMILTPDTIICAGTTKQLRTKPSLKFCWSPTTYLDNPNSPNPITSAPADITYYFNAEATGNNLIVNGDFSAGNAGFTSAYVYSSNNTTEGQYFVGPNPTAWNSSLSTCSDHTGSNGNMMMVNGSPVADVGVWKQTVNVTPNTNYAFSTWIQALWPPNPAQLSFSINGKDIGNLITASLPTCTLTQFYATWNSGPSTTAVISIVNKNTLVQGNDFALDDISFAPVFIKRDSVFIKVDNPVVKTINDTSVCPGSTVELKTTGAAGYTWTPANGLSSTTISNPVTTVLNSTQYIVTGRSADNCLAKDTVVVTAFPKLNVTISNDTAICGGTQLQLTAGGGISYSWSPSGTLNNTSINNPIATPTTTTVYVVQVTDANTCTNKDSMTVSIRADRVFKVSPDGFVCEGVPKKLNASGGDVYSWSPALYLDNPNSASPTALPISSVQYSVAISDTVCHFDSVLTVNLAVRPNPTVTASRTNDINCSNPTTQVQATGAISYAWSPESLVDNPRMANPIASMDTSSVLAVMGTDQFGCVGLDSVTVNVTKDGAPLFMLPNAFTPNNDGKNDCFGIKRWGNVHIQELSIYNRWGQRVFTTKNPAECWNGYFKGVLQEPGGYAYTIKARGFCGDIIRNGMLLLIR